MTSAEYQQLIEFMGRQFAEIDRRFGRVDRRSDDLDLRFTELRHDVLGHFDEIYRGFERLEQECHATSRS